MDEVVGWHHRLDGHESEQAPGVGDGQAGLACCSPWGRKESNMTQQLTQYAFFLSVDGKETEPSENASEFQDMQRGRAMQC